MYVLFFNDLFIVLTNSMGQNISHRLEVVCVEAWSSITHTEIRQYIKSRDVQIERNYRTL